MDLSCLGDSVSDKAVRKFLECQQNLDTTSIGDALAEKVVLYSATSEPFRGKDKVVGFLQMFFSHLIEKVEFSAVKKVDDHNQYLVLFKNTMKGQDDPIVGAGLLTVRDGLIVSVHDCVDTLGLPDSVKDAFTSMNNT